MAQHVQKKKQSVNLSVAITSTIFLLIPVIILLIIGTSTFETPYGIYALSTFGMVVYFSFLFAMLAWRNKILYLIWDGINIAAALGFILYSYINSSYQEGLLLHLSAAFFLILSFYQMADADQKDSYYALYLVPLLFDIAGLIFVLWFINVHMNVVVHIVLVTIFNIFNLAVFFLPALVKLFSNRKEYFSGLSNKCVEYDEESEEEKERRKVQKSLKNEKNKQKNTVTNNSSVFVDSGTRWRVAPIMIRVWRQEILEKFNKVIDRVNLEIKSNNFEIDHPSNKEYYDNAVKSNKQLEKGCKYLRKHYAIMKKNIDALEKKVFTAEDCYKKYTYSILDGKWKVKSSDEKLPHLDLLYAEVYFTAITEYGGKNKYVFHFDGENNVSLPEIK